MFLATFIIFIALLFISMNFEFNFGLNLFMAFFLLIKLIMQQLSELLMFEIAILLRFMEIINKSWHLLQTFGETWNHNSRNTNSDIYHTLLMNLFYQHQLLQKRLSKYSIYKIKTFFWKNSVLDLPLYEPFSKNILW